MSNTEKDDFSEINEYFAKVKAQKQKTKRQIACEPKEKTFTCEQCGEQFTAKTNHAKYCKDCAKQRQRERVKAYNENRKNLKVRELGSKDICTECGKEYTVVSGAQKVCEACRHSTATRHHIRPTGGICYEEPYICLLHPQSQQTEGLLR